jgi:hypothetical protein
MTSSHTERLRVKRGERTGQIVYYGRDGYGCANDDTRMTGVEHGAYSLNESGEPFFTLPKADVELLSDEERDPTPWCTACGAKHKRDCHCGPIAENE